MGHKRIAGGHSRDTITIISMKLLVRVMANIELSVIIITFLCEVSSRKRSSISVHLGKWCEIVAGSFNRAA